MLLGHVVCAFRRAARRPAPIAGRSMFAFTLGTAALLAAPSGMAQGTTINASVTLVESAQESAPVERATKDLERDFAKVFGQSPKLVSNLKEVTGPTAILIAQQENVPAGVECATTSNREAFAFSIASTGNGKRTICLTGADMRGTI